MKHHEYREFEFEAPELCPICNVPWESCSHAPWDKEPNLSCPSCGSKEHLAPAWIKKYRLPGEIKNLEKLRKLDREIEEVRKKEA